MWLLASAGTTNSKPPTRSRHRCAHRDAGSPGAESAFRPGPRPPGRTRPAPLPRCPRSSPRSSAGCIPPRRETLPSHNRPVSDARWSPGPGTHAPPRPRPPPARMKPCARASAIRPAPTKPTRNWSRPGAATTAISPPPRQALPRPTPSAPPMGYAAPPCPCLLAAWTSRPAHSLPGSAPYRSTSSTAPVPPRAAHWSGRAGRCGSGGRGAAPRLPPRVGESGRSPASGEVDEASVAGFWGPGVDQILIGA